jgi:hypothetical protein
MSGYENGFLSVAAASGAPYLTFHTGSLSRARIQELAIFVNAATASSVGLIRPANTPVATTSTLGQPDDPNEPVPTSSVDTAWSTAPTITGNVFLRRIVIPATIGQGVIWTWPDGKELIVNVSSYLVLWNFGASAGSILSGYVRWIE